MCDFCSFRIPIPFVEYEIHEWRDNNTPGALLGTAFTGPGGVGLTWYPTVRTPNVKQIRIRLVNQVVPYPVTTVEFRPVNQCIEVHFNLPLPKPCQYEHEYNPPIIY
jgi:hypothetical protein